MTSRLTEAAALARSSRFHAQALSREWAGESALAQVCERTCMTEREARALLLAVAYGRNSYAIAEILQVPRSAACLLLRSARRKAGELLEGAELAAGRGAACEALEAG